MLLKMGNEKTQQTNEKSRPRNGPGGSEIFLPYHFYRRRQGVGERGLRAPYLQI